MQNHGKSKRIFPELFAEYKYRIGTTFSNDSVLILNGFSCDKIEPIKV